MQIYEIFLNLPNFLVEKYVKKYKLGNVSRHHPIKTKNLTIQIMENKERYHNAKRAFEPQSGLEPLTSTTKDTGWCSTNWTIEV